MKECDCVKGQAFVLNDEEGAAWKRPYIRNSSTYKLDDGDWIVKFRFCPCCGKENNHTKDSEYL